MYTVLTTLLGLYFPETINNAKENANFLFSHTKANNVQHKKSSSGGASFFWVVIQISNPIFQMVGQQTIEALKI